ncbi:hypothetical protein Tco_1380701 [Tanacetum coccineum]
MADLTFADSHNMVAYLEKLEDNANFAEIVDFLNASPIRQGKKISGTVTPLFATMLIQSQAVKGEEPIPIVASSSQPKKTQKHRKTKRNATEISYSSGPTTLIADKTIHEERGDSVERAATTATSLDSNEPPLLRVNTLGSGEDSMKLQELMDLCTKLSERVLALENVKNAQALEIQKLKKRVKKLESKKKSRTPQLKRRLFKVRIESSANKSLGDQEDSSKQGRNEIDQDEGISWFQEDSKTQGSAPVTTAGVSVSTAEPSTPTTTTTTTLIEDEDLTIAQTLMKMKSEKSKAKGVTMQEPSESGTKVRVPPPQIDPKDKGKAKMVEPEKPKKKKDQIEMMLM